MSHDQPLRILHLYPKGDYFTGAAIQLRELARGLRQRGHEVVVATRPSAEWAARAEADGVVHYALPMASQVDLASVRGLIRILRKHRIQVVHAHKGRARTLTLLAGFAVRIPVLVVQRGVSFPLGLNRWGYRHPRVSAVVAVCEAIKQRLVAAGVPAAKVHVIYSGTDTERFHPGVDGAPIRRALGLGPEDFLITQVGVRSWKGNHDVLEALARVAARCAGARLLLVGARRPEGLLERARACGVEGRVTVWGYREDIPEILAASDCCVDASWAGLGITGALREALAVGRPVVATALEGNPELVIPGETGLLVEPRNPRALADALLRVAADPALRTRLGEQGRRLVERRFSLRIKLDATEALYRRLLAERSAR